MFWNSTLFQSTSVRPRSSLAPYTSLQHEAVASADCRYEQHIYIKPGFTPRLYGSSVRLRYSKLEFLISRLTFCHSEAFFFRLCTRQYIVESKVLITAPHPLLLLLYSTLFSTRKAVKFIGLEGAVLPASKSGWSGARKHVRQSSIHRWTRAGDCVYV